MEAAVAAGKLGLGADNYSDIGGCLVDMAATELLLGRHVQSLAAARRAKYMSGRAYQPDGGLMRDIEILVSLKSTTGMSVK